MFRKKAIKKVETKEKLFDYIKVRERLRKLNYWQRNRAGRKAYELFEKGMPWKKAQMLTDSEEEMKGKLIKEKKKDIFEKVTYSSGQKISDILEGRGLPIEYAEELSWMFIGEKIEKTKKNILKKEARKNEHREGPRKADPELVARRYLKDARKNTGMVIKMIKMASGIGELEARRILRKVQEEEKKKRGK